jgi:hypothetical protein
MISHESTRYRHDQSYEGLGKIMGVIEH